MKLRDYQKKAINDTLRLVNDGNRVVIVSPTGSGKSVMLSSIVSRALKAGAKVLAVAHRNTITLQLAEYFGKEVSVVTINKLLNYLHIIEKPDLLILDECHHYAAPDWKRVFNVGAKAIIGATATPVRADGKHLGNAFDKMVVAADYPELISAGHLVPLDIVGPGKCIAPDLSKSPVRAYLEYAGRKKCFCFARNVEQAKRICMDFEAEGVGAGLILHDTPREIRSKILAGFRGTTYDIIVNIYTMTEGVDVPDASCCLLARGCSHMSPYLQMVGRVLRPAKNKNRALLIDLPGMVHLWGDPTASHVYSLEKGIELEKPITVFECPACGYAEENRFLVCKKCGHELDKKIQKNPKIYDMALSKVYAGSATPDNAKRDEMLRLIELHKRNGYTWFWVSNQYKKLFGERPNLSNVSEEGKRIEFQKHRKQGEEKGYKPGWAKFRYKETFGHWPSKKW